MFRENSPALIDGKLTLNNNDDNNNAAAMDPFLADAAALCAAFSALPAAAPRRKLVGTRAEDARKERAAKRAEAREAREAAARRRIVLFRERLQSGLLTRPIRGRPHIYLAELHDPTLCGHALRARQVATRVATQGRLKGKSSQQRGSRSRVAREVLAAQRERKSARVLRRNRLDKMAARDCGIGPAV